jgi:hypothetical protein
MAGRPVLQELGGAQSRHPREEVASQKLHVAHALHCRLWWEQVQRPPPPNAAEIPPDHDTGGMLDVNPILHTAWLNNHALTLKEILQNIILVKNPVFCIPS